MSTRLRRRESGVTASIYLNAWLEQLSVDMVSSGELEVKAVIQVHALVFAPEKSQLYHRDHGKSSRSGRSQGASGLPALCGAALGYALGRGPRRTGHDGTDLRAERSGIGGPQAGPEADTGEGDGEREPIGKKRAGSPSSLQRVS